MKLVRIDHDRCNEPDGVTWCFAPDDWNEATLEEAVYRAKRAYTNALDAFMQASKEQGFNSRPGWYYPSSQPDFKSYPDLTVGEVLVKHEQKIAKLKRQYEIAMAATHNFAHFLEKEGLTQFHNAEPAFKVEIDWGHQHGVPLDYQQKSPWDLDKQGAAKKDDDD